MEQQQANASSSPRDATVPREREREQRDTTSAVRLPPLAFLPPDRQQNQDATPAPNRRQKSGPQRKAGTPQQDDDGQQSKADTKKDKKKAEKQSPRSPTASLALARLALLSLLLVVGSFLAFLSLGLYLTALINNVWVETPSATGLLFTDKVSGKSTEQYILLVLAVCIGGVGCIGLAVILTAAYRRQRMDGRLAGSLKMLCILLIAAMTGLGYATVGLTPSPNSAAGQQYGSGESYARMALEYGVIGCALLLVQECLFRLFLFFRLKKYGINLAEKRSVALSKRLAMDKVTTTHTHSMHAELTHAGASLIDALLRVSSVCC
jgi:hypothetical protein